MEFKIKHCLEKIAYEGSTGEDTAYIFNRLEHKEVILKEGEPLNQQILSEHLLNARQSFRCNMRNKSENQSPYPQRDHSLISEITKGPGCENYSSSVIAKDLFQ